MSEFTLPGIPFFDIDDREIRSAKFKAATKLHQILEIAIHDFKLVLKDPHYSINMGTWHTYLHRQDQCAVCLAGSVIAKTFNTKYAINKVPSNFGEHLEHKFGALDCLRRGKIYNAYQHITSEEVVPKHVMHLSTEWNMSNDIPHEDDEYIPYLEKLVDALKKLDI